MKKQIFIAIQLLGLITAIFMFGGNALAAGSLSITGQASSASVLTGANNSYVVSVTPSGANVSSFTFTASFTNATYSSYSPQAGSLFVNSVVNGDIGSTTITITAATMEANGLSGKINVGTINVASSSGAGTASMQLSLTESYDQNLDGMTPQNSTASYQITSPPPPPQPAQQPSSPAANPTSPSTPAATPSTPSTAQPDTSSPTAPVAEITAPPESQVVIPNDNGEPTIMTETEANEILITQNPDVIELNSETPEESVLRKLLPFGIGILALAGLGGAGTAGVIVMRRRSIPKSGIVLGSAAAPKEDIIAESIAKSKAMVNPVVGGVKVQQEPTVIYPSGGPDNKIT